MKLVQSMSRRGNCWDNAPQESFFGHFKDETNIKECETLEDEEVEEDIDSTLAYMKTAPARPVRPIEDDDEDDREEGRSPLGFGRGKGGSSGGYKPRH